MIRKEIPYPAMPVNITEFPQQDTEWSVGWKVESALPNWNVVLFGSRRLYGIESIEQKRSDHMIEPASTALTLRALPST